MARFVINYKLQTIIKAVLLLALLFSVLIAASYFIIRWAALSQVERSLEKQTKRVQEVLIYDNGVWDTTLYNSDPNTAYPTSSSPYPLYIITTDGFVIERSKPINGLLDTANYNQLINFNFPRSISAKTNENWRVLSVSIDKNGASVGVIFVSYYNPENAILDKIDKKLQENAENIKSKLTIDSDGSINISKLDVRNVQYDVSFEIVNKFNKVLLNSGRVPTFIDTSYVSNELKKPQPSIVIDQMTGEWFLVSSQTLTDKSNQPVGIVVVGRSIDYINDILMYYLITAIPLSIILVPILSFLIFGLISREDSQQNKLKKIRQIQTELLTPKSVQFDKKNSILHLDERVIEIPYASNQYLLCKALFSAPQKRWEQDELLAKFGEEISNANVRKVYDTAIAVNKKAGVRLILYQDKTYRLNPDYRYLS